MGRVNTGCPRSLQQSPCLAQVQVCYSLFIKTWIASHPLVLACTLMYGSAHLIHSGLFLLQGATMGLYGAPRSHFVVRDLCKGFAFTGAALKSPPVSLTFVTHWKDLDAYTPLGHSLSPLSILGKKCRQICMMWYYNNVLQSVVKEGVGCSNVWQCLWSLGGGVVLANESQSF